ncbi:MAG: hypothetical protein R3A79_06215 [Nannocystaceae bacterium]
MTETTTTPAKIDREGLLAVQMLKDSFLLGLAGATITALSTSFSFLSWAFHGFVAFVAIFFGVLIVQAIFNATRETLVRKLLGWASVSGILYMVYADAGQLAVYFGVGAFLFTALHTLLLHRRQDAEFRSEQAEKAGSHALAERLAVAAQSGAAPLPRSIDRGVAELPSDLEPAIRRLVDDAVEDFTHLHELVSDPGLKSSFARDHEALLAEAEAVLVDLLRRAPLVSRVQRLASRRADDERGRSAAASALARLERQAKALHDAASAALQLAASDRPEAVAGLREHIDDLNALREARDELERELAEDA